MNYIRIRHVIIIILISFFGLIARFGYHIRLMYDCCLFCFMRLVYVRVCALERPLKTHSIDCSFIWTFLFLYFFSLQLMVLLLLYCFFALPSAYNQRTTTTTAAAALYAQLAIYRHHNAWIEITVLTIFIRSYIERCIYPLFLASFVWLVVRYRCTMCTNTVCISISISICLCTYVRTSAQYKMYRDSVHSLKRAFFSACFCCEYLWRILWNKCCL